MPRYQLTLDRAQVYEIGDRRYEVPARGFVEIPDALAFVVARRGLPLVAVDKVPADAPPARVVLEGKPPAPILAQLPEGRREDFVRAWEGCASQGERSALLREVQRWIASQAAIDEQDDEEPVALDDEEPAPVAAPSAPDDGAAAEIDIEQQINAAAKAVGRGRRRVKE